MVRNSGFVEFVLDMLSPLGGVAERRMFGGCGLFRDGVMFAIVADDALYFKTDEANQADFEAAGSAPFVYRRRGRRIAMSYHEVPPDVMDDPEVLSAWARKALDVALHAKRPARRGKS